jgi:Secretion system C-terminal sorting domain
MKKLLFSFFLILSSFFGYSQNGLECVEVEVYYISDVNDSLGNDAIPAATGSLPSGSVTYRVYANMLPGYNFQAGYGVPGHELRLETTTLFYNNEDRGATSPTYTKTQARANTVMLDTWLSVGAGCAGNFGILKSEDDGVATVVNSDSPPRLQNADPNAGIPLTQQDGLILTAATPASVTFVGFTTPEMNAINNTTFGNQNLISTTNASWAALGGAVGPDSAINRVIIGQFTTKGTFSFKLNIQIGTPTGGVENYVAENPIAPEIQLACLTFVSDSLWTEVEKQNDAPSAPSMFSIYPNPAQDFVMLTMNNTTRKFLNGTLRIYDVTGKMILNEQVASWEQKRREKIDISSLKSGIYFIEATIDGITAHQKFVKN